MRLYRDHFGYIAFRTGKGRYWRWPLVWLKTYQDLVNENESLMEDRARRIALKSGVIHALQDEVNRLAKQVKKLEKQLEE